ncbi:MAG TPA: Fur family transcriptional regulator [Opitutaceae bacterium]|nr:Fur family transcriptional regulator [Opitutaceae bacterium]
MIASTQTNHPLAGTQPPATPPKGEKPIEIVCARLKSAGMRITQPRIAILSALLARRQPASIEQIFADLEDRSCDLVTVYRCLAVFEALGLVRRSYFHNGTSLYEIKLDEESRYHVVCKQTNAVEEIDPALAAELRRAVFRIEESLRLRGYGEISHLVEFFGVAPAGHPRETTTPLPVRSRN